MMNGPEAAERFTGLIANWGSAYRRLLLVYVAYKHANEWRLSYGGAAFQTDPMPQGVVTDLRVHTPNFKAGRRWLDCAKVDVKSLVATLLRGAIEVEGEEIAIGDTNPSTSTYHLHPDSPPGLPKQNVRTPTMVVSHNKGGNFNNELDVEEIENNLRCGDQPYDGLDDLFGTLGVPADVRSTNIRRVEVYFHLPVILALPGSHITDSIAHMRLLVSPNASTSDVTIGLRIPRQGADTERKSIHGSEIEWALADSWLEGSIDVPVGTAIYAQCFVQYKAEHVSHWWISDPSKHANFRTIIQRSFDSEDRKLKKLLFPAKTDARDLEKGVGLLLGIHGFGVLSYGEKESFQEGPDLIAITPSNRILVVECSIELPDVQSKIAKLKMRAQKILDLLRSANFGHLEVIPLLATTMTRLEVDAHAEFFGRSGIAVATRDDLDALLERLGLPEHPDGICDEIKRLIPSAA